MRTHQCLLSSSARAETHRRLRPVPAWPRHRAGSAPPTRRQATVAAETRPGYAATEPPGAPPGIGAWPWPDLPHPADDVACAPPSTAELAGVTDPTPPTGPSNLTAPRTHRVPTGPTGLAGPTDLARLTREAEQALSHLATATHTEPVGADDIDLLLRLLAAVDLGQAALAILTSRLQGDRLVHRHTGLGFGSLLDAQSALPTSEHRRLLRTAEVLRGMPQLTAALAAGQVPAACLPGLVGELRRLRQAERALCDRGFGPGGRLPGLSGDELLDAISQLVARLRPDIAAADEQRTMHDRMLALTPGEDGRLTGYFELDAEAGATLLAAVDRAAPPPVSGPEDTGKHALDLPPHRRAPENWDRRSRNRQRADGLLRLCEQYLAHPQPHDRRASDVGPAPADTAPADTVIHNHHPDGSGGRSAPAGAGGHPGTHGGPDDARHRCEHRAHPRLLVMTDIATLTGDDAHAHAARLLWATASGPVRLTPEATRRLASDAILRFILHDRGLILGTTAPTATIPSPLRDAVTARDQQCRFPGCHAPIAWCDLHHVVPRHRNGPTTPENLVALCRRHHTAVTNGAWALTMTPDGTVTVSRGHRRATSHAPQQQPPSTIP